MSAARKPTSNKPAAPRFEVGDHVAWNSEAGHVSGVIIRVHVRDFDYKGHTHRASPDDPQYEIKSDKTDHIAAHRGRVLTRLPITGLASHDRELRPRE